MSDGFTDYNQEVSEYICGCVYRKLYRVKGQGWLTLVENSETKNECEKHRKNNMNCVMKTIPPYRTYMKNMRTQECRNFRYYRCSSEAFVDKNEPKDDDKLEFSAEDIAKVITHPEFNEFAKRILKK